MLLIEIILTIVAWSRGWKWLALLPLGIVLLLGFIIGFGIGASGGNVSNIGGGVIILDILAIVALVIMSIIKPKNKNTSIKAK